MHKMSLTNKLAAGTLALALGAGVANYAKAAKPEDVKAVADFAVEMGYTASELKGTDLEILLSNAPESARFLILRNKKENYCRG